MKHLFMLSAFLIVFNIANIPVHGQVVLDETTVDTNTVITGLDIPWEILYGPDGWLWLTERYGRVSRVHPETGTHDIILDHSGVVHQQGESGMLGMALHPEFPADPRVYIVYTYMDGGIKERLVHFTYDGILLVDETTLIDGIQGNTTHDGSRLMFAPDGKLLMTTGDAQNLSAPQDIGHLSGKILRINPDGTVPEDNPFENSYVYTYGHRNAQGLFFSPGGILYSSEHGPSSDDEINLIEAGRNYGWPDVMGFCDTPGEQQFCADNDVKEPMIAWTPTIAPSDIIYYDSDAISEWKGSILLTLLKNKRLVELELSEDGLEITGENHYFINYWGRLRDVCTGPDGELYLATNGESWNNNNPFSHSIIRVMPQSSTGDSRNGDSGTGRVRVSGSGERLIIDSGASLMRSRWFILDTQGRVRDSGLIQTPKTIISHQLESGIYILRVDRAPHSDIAQKFFIH
jgi:aldose sugar dehydrogenase